MYLVTGAIHSCFVSCHLYLVIDTCCVSCHLVMHSSCVSCHLVIHSCCVSCHRVIHSCVSCHLVIHSCGVSCHLVLHSCGVRIYGNLQQNTNTSQVRTLLLNCCVCYFTVQTAQLVPFNVIGALRLFKCPQNSKH